MHSAIWIRPNSVKQGEVVILSGLYYPFEKGNVSFLNECKIQFENNEYKFSKEILNWEEYIKSQKQNGFHFITRIPTTPLSQIGQKKMTLLCPNGSETFSINILAGNFTIQSIKLSKKKNSLQRTEIEDKAVKKAINTFSPNKLWDDSKSWLIPNNARQSASYGLRRKYNGVLAKDYFHKGIDYAGWTGSPVKSPAKGKVILLGKEKEGFAVHGNCLFIDHGQGVVSAYLHLSEFYVEENQEVTAGQLIGKVGNSGIATGPHLHFGLYVNGQSVNPSRWLSESTP
ncbi:MAG: M23 family metallopeptidase [Candidatus Caenarcaniphilales bacterium]|nr:M23 family metallopeptidase [Candidatus Caenarcaniphilales bacterium]